MSRDKSDRSPGAVLLADILSVALREHALQRCKHYFYYAFTMKVLVSWLEFKYGFKLAGDVGVEVKATHQIDDGFRIALGQGYDDFNDADANVVNRSCTTFRNTDAAHFCNLGLDPAFVGKYYALDNLTKDLCLRLQKYAGDTRWLPQRVNIGPDRIIDVLHGKLASAMLVDGTDTIVSSKRILTYMSAAIDAMTEYGKGLVAKGKHGVAACAQCYISAYQDAQFGPLVYRNLSEEIVGLCRGYNNGIDPAKFLSA